MLTSSLLVTAISRSASSAPAASKVSGREAWPWMVWMSSRSFSSFRRAPSSSTSVMSKSSLARFSASVPPV